MNLLFPDWTSGALFSDCRRYRYALWRWWRPTGPGVVFIGLNPSTADEANDDNTVRLMINRARQMDRSGLIVLNIFAFRATDPRVMKQQEDPIGPGNDLSIRIWSKLGVVICGWGNHGAHMGRGDAVRKMLTKPLYHLKLNNSGQPQHPLYVPYSVQPTLWEVIEP